MISASDTLRSYKLQRTLFWAALLANVRKNDPLERLAIGLRELPSRFLNRSSRSPLDLDDFTFLGREGDSGLALGLTGAFWRADYGLLDIGSPEAFKATVRMDVCQLVTSFNVQANASGASVLSTETRVFCPTAPVRRRFASYWYITSPVSGLIRRRMLARAQRRAESLTKER